MSLPLRSVATIAERQNGDVAAKHATVVQALDDSFGSWTDRNYDGEGYVEGLRRGMARRLRHMTVLVDTSILIDHLRVSVG